MTANDRILYRGECRAVQDICGERGLVALNVHACFNVTANAVVPIHTIIRRVLSSEEFFRYLILN